MKKIKGGILQSGVKREGLKEKQIEIKKANITERTIRDICREYNVNLNWLVNGIEPMFEDVTNELDIDDEVKQLARKYSMLNDDDRELIKKMIDSLVEKVNKQCFI